MYMQDITLIKIYVKNRKHFTTYDPTELSPVDMRNNTVLNTRYLGLVSTPEYKSGVYIDLSHIFSEQQLGKVLTWTEFLNDITPHVIDSYKIDGVGMDSKITKHPVNIHVMASPEFNISYCDSLDPTIRDRKMSKFDMKDLVISKKSQYIKDTQDINLSNCIVSVNGIVSKSWMMNDELYIANGAAHLWDTNKTTSIDMFMTDMTPLGDVTRIALSACKLTYKNPKGSSSIPSGDPLLSDVLITLPTAYDLSKYSVFLCIAGKIDMPDEVSVHNKNTIRLSPYKMQLPLRLLSIQASRAGYISDTEIYTPEITPSEYVRTLGKTDFSDIYDGIYLVKNDSIFIQREQLITEIGWYTKYGFGQHGICVRLSDRSWMDYSTLEFNDMYYTHGVRWPHDVIQLTSDSASIQYGIRDISNPVVEQYTKSHKLSSYEMVYITG